MSRTNPKPEAPAGLAAQVTPEIVERVRQRATEGRISCPALRRLAEELGVPVRVAGIAADEAGVKVRDCELGCF